MENVESAQGLDARHTYFLNKRANGEWIALLGVTGFTLLALVSLILNPATTLFALAALGISLFLTLEYATRAYFTERVYPGDTGKMDHDIAIQEGLV